MVTGYVIDTTTLVQEVNDIVDSMVMVLTTEGVITVISNAIEAGISDVPTARNERMIMTIGEDMCSVDDYPGHWQFIDGQQMQDEKYRQYMQDVACVERMFGLIYAFCDTQVFIPRGTYVVRNAGGPIFVALPGGTGY